MWKYQIIIPKEHKKQIISLLGELAYECGFEEDKITIISDDGISDMKSAYEAIGKSCAKIGIDYDYDMIYVDKDGNETSLDDVE